MSVVIIWQKLSSQPFVGLAFEMDYMVRIVPFPTFMNDSFFPPSFLHTNSELGFFSAHKSSLIMLHISRCFNPVNHTLVRCLTVKNFMRGTWIIFALFSQVAKCFLAQTTLSANHVSSSGLKTVIHLLRWTVTCKEVSSWSMSFSLWITYNNKYNNGMNFLLCFDSLEAQDAQRLPARLESAHRFRPRSSHLWLQHLLPVLQASTGEPLQTQTLQTG